MVKAHGAREGLMGVWVGRGVAKLVVRGRGFKK
jgi:hypothetical protein